MLDGVRAARRAGVRTAMLSNSWGEDRYDRALLAELFDAWVISGEVGLRKPDPAIYELAAERLGLPPAACVFVDDLPGNLKPARALGHGHRPAPRRRRRDARRGRRAPRASACADRDHGGERHDDAELLRARDALGEHDAGEHDRDRRVERADHRDDAEQPLGGGEREQRRGRGSRARRSAAAGAASRSRRRHRRAQRQRDRAEQQRPRRRARTAATTARRRPRSRRRSARRSCRSPSAASSASPSEARTARLGSAAPPGSRAASTMPTSASAIPATWIVARPLAADHADQHRDRGAGGRDRRDDAHRPDRQPAVEGRQRGAAGHAGAERQRRRPPRPGTGRRTRARTRVPSATADQLGDEQDRDQRPAARLQAAHEVGGAPGQRGGEGEGDGEHAPSLGA